jgi:hypothetical protein
VDFFQTPRPGAPGSTARHPRLDVPSPAQGRPPAPMN